jgi:hypothetical protein
VLARDRGAIVSARLTQAQGIDASQVSVQTWEAAEPDIEGEPGVDVQLRAE